MDRKADIGLAVGAGQGRNAFETKRAPDIRLVEGAEGGLIVIAIVVVPGAGFGYAPRAAQPVVGAAPARTASRIPRPTPTTGPTPSREEIRACGRPIRAAIQAVLAEAVKPCEKPDLDRAAKRRDRIDQEPLDDEATFARLRYGALFEPNRRGRRVIFDAGPFYAGFGIVVQLDAEAFSSCTAAIFRGQPFPVRHSRAAALCGDAIPGATLPVSIGTGAPLIALAHRLRPRTRGAPCAGCPGSTPVNPLRRAPATFPSRR
ncbi:hypothetical protein [Methylobacterium fujisawaense]